MIHEFPLLYSSIGVGHSALVSISYFACLPLPQAGYIEQIVNPDINRDKSQR
jgi:hypothetical protein